jgi:hypothetical protein
MGASSGYDDVAGAGVPGEMLPDEVGVGDTVRIDEEENLGVGFRSPVVACPMGSEAGALPAQ